MLKCSNRVVSSFAGLRISSEPVCGFILNNDSHRIMVLALLFFPNDDVVSGHAIAEVHGFYFFAILRCAAARIFPPMLRFSCFCVVTHRTIWIFGKVCQVVLSS